MHARRVACTPSSRIPKQGASQQKKVTPSLHAKAIWLDVLVWVRAPYPPVRKRLWGMESSVSMELLVTKWSPDCTHSRSHHYVSFSKTKINHLNAFFLPLKVSLVSSYCYMHLQKFYLSIASFMWPNVICRKGFFYCDKRLKNLNPTTLQLLPKWNMMDHSAVLWTQHKTVCRARAVILINIGLLRRDCLASFCIGQSTILFRS